MQEKKIGVRFKRYSSIERARDKRVAEIRASGLAEADVVWVATEKVHGANFSFATDGEEVRVFKRTSEVKEDERFHPGWETVVAKYREHVLRLFELCRARYSDVDVQTVTVYGELFGGSYPHPDVPALAGVKHVQKHVYYTPELDFFPFDITLNMRSFLPFEETTELLGDAGFAYYVQALFTGTFDECLAYEVNTMVPELPARLGLPPLENNIAEGVVVRPLKYAANVAGARTIIKVKSEAFEETTSRPKKNKPARKPKPSPLDGELSEAAAPLWEELERHITLNRVINTLSKLGPVSNEKQLRKVIGLSAKDAMDELRKDYASEIDSLDHAQRKSLTARLNLATSRLVRQFEDDFLAGNL